MAFKTNIRFFVYHQISKFPYFLINFKDIFKYKYSYNKYFKNGFVEFNNDETKSIARTILKKIKKAESLNKKEFSSPNGGLFIDDIGKEFPEIFNLYSSQLGDVIREIYGCHFKIFYGVLSKNIGANKPRQGSQLWHNDGGPGTCINLMFYLDDVKKENGPLEIIKWNFTKKVYWFEIRNLKKDIKNLTKLNYRLKRSDQINSLIERQKLNVFETCEGSQGNIVLFANNTFHRGGFPEKGNNRIAIILHLYPSRKLFKGKNNKENSLKKIASFPDNPNFNELP
jgi:hypothetical protein